MRQSIQRVFDQPVAATYPDWGVTVPDLAYRSIRRAPPYQTFSRTQDTFNSRMLPLLMAGAVISNAYVTLQLPWPRPKNGPVVEDWPEENYRVANHEIEISGDLRPGRVIRVNLHYSKRDWKLADPSRAAVEPDGAGTAIGIREPCPSVRIVHRMGLDLAGWIVAGLSLGAAALLVRRDPRGLGEAS